MFMGLNKRVHAKRGAEALKVTAGSRLILYASLFQVMMGFGIIFPLLPSYLPSIGGSAVHLGLFIMVGSGAQVLLSPAWGRFSDRVGRRRVLLIGLLGHFISWVLMALAPTVFWLLAAQLVGGMLAAAVIPAAQAYIADTSTDQSRAQAMGALGAVLSMGFLTGPAIGGLLVPFGMKATFLFAAAFTLSNALFTLLFLPEPGARARAAQGAGLPLLQMMRAALAGPERVYYMLAFVSTFGGSTLFAMLGFYLVDRMGAPESMLAAAYTFQGLVMMVAQGAVTPVAVRYLGEEIMIKLCLLSGIIGFAGFMFATEYWHVALSLLFVTGSNGLMRPLAASVVSRRSRLDQGITMGTQGSFDALGRTVAPPLAGALFGLHTSAPYTITILVNSLFLVWVVLEARRSGRAPQAGAGGA